MKKNNLTGVLVLLVFAVFMVSVLFVLLTGADVVQKLTDRDQRSYQQRTAVQYVTMRVHQADREGMVEVRKLGDQDVLVLAEMIEGCRYETLVYCVDGYLWEMFSEAGLDLPLEFGEKILPAAGFLANKQEDALLLQIEFTDGSSQRVILHLRSKGEVSA